MKKHDPRALEELDEATVESLRMLRKLVSSLCSLEGVEGRPSCSIGETKNAVVSDGSTEADELLGMVTQMVSDVKSMTAELNRLSVLPSRLSIQTA